MNKKEIKEQKIIDKRTKKLIRIFKMVLIVSLVIIILEVIGFFVIKYLNEQKNTYYDNYSSSIKSDNTYIAVGDSFFYKSKYNKFTDGIKKGKLIVIEDNKIKLEVQYNGDRLSNFTDVLKEEDSYIIVGYAEFNDYQTENNITDAFIIKYDLKGNKVWEKTYSVLSNTKFNRIIKDGDNYVVVGSSIYEGMELGNHTTGGGIIVKFDKDGNILKVGNHGGNKSGAFNDVIKVKNDYYVVGKDGSDSGNIVKFNNDLEYQFHKNYSYTDIAGHQKLTLFEDKIYVVSSKKILEDEKAEKRNTTNTDGLILVYDLKGKLINEKRIGGSSYERLTGIIVLNNNLYITGLSSSTDWDLKINLKKSKETISSGFIMKLDKDLNIIDKKVLGGTNNDIINDIKLSDNNLIVSGLSNSKNSSIKNNENNKDYNGKIIDINDKLEINVIR